jgi:hypothetical protein
MAALLEASGDEVLIERTRLVQTRWRMFDGVDVHSVVRAQWLALFEGMLGVHNRFLTLLGEQASEGFAIRVVG